MNFDEADSLTQFQFENRFRKDRQGGSIAYLTHKSAFKAYDTFTRKDVFVKLFDEYAPHRQIACDLSIRDIANLNHPAIIRFLSLYRLIRVNSKQEIFITVLEYFPGNTLKELIPILSEQEKYNIIGQICAGVSYLHSNGFVHQDLKCENFLIVKSNNEYIAKISDIDLIDVIGKTPTFIVGSIEYMAPECLGIHKLQPTLDYWSLGCSIYELFTNQLPFGLRKSNLTHKESVEEYVTRINEKYLKNIIDSMHQSTYYKLFLKDLLVIEPINRKFSNEIPLSK